MTGERSGDEHADHGRIDPAAPFNRRVLGDQPSGISHLSVTGLIMGRGIAPDPYKDVLSDRMTDPAASATMCCTTLKRLKSSKRS
jgi:hypothetical protein